MIDAAALPPEALLERLELGQQLRAVVSELSEEKRQVFQMIYEEDMDISTVAQKLGIPEGTVKSRLYGARRELKELYQKHFK